MLVAITIVSADGRREEHLALNEAVVERAADANTIRLAVAFDDEFFTTYAADGLIVASPTGSTAYAFSARGPIIDPTHRALLLTPVSPHMLFDRSLVLAPETRVRLTVDWNQRVYDERHCSTPNLTRLANLPDTAVVELKFDRGDRKLANRYGQGIPLRLSRNSKYVIGVEAISHD